MNYYDHSLNGSNLEKCYLLAPERVKKYLSEEINYAASMIKQKDSILELGCGYGRIIFKIADKANSITGIDISRGNIDYANFLNLYKNCTFLQMDALQLNFEDNSFDHVLCLQNGICAFHAEKTALVKEALRVTKPGGKAVFTSYSKKFWQDRLQWFEIQADHGLLGEIDYTQSKNNTIVCKDGFSSGAIDKQGFLDIAQQLLLSAEIKLIDNASLVCIYTKN